VSGRSGTTLGCHARANQRNWRENFSHRKSETETGLVKRYNDVAGVVSRVIEFLAAGAERCVLEAHRIDNGTNRDSHYPRLDDLIVASLSYLNLGGSGGDSTVVDPDIGSARNGPEFAGQVKLRDACRSQ
jgi:hypothetical protein